LLSMGATAGEEASNVLRLTNYGTGNVKDIALDADAPPQWEVTFPQFVDDTVGELPINQQIDVQVKITAPDDTIPGDYMVTLRGRSQDALGEVDIRVTVDQSTIWGWLGIVLVLLVVGGLLGVFWRLGRR
ncbi:MAG: NEW3 domain-containing protein, partial [Chloroflexi bacterium]|nr:NEW3 domain-containing protein [Chloroflexota bacterium]